MNTAKRVLSTRMQEDNDAGAETVGDYLVKLLEAMFADVEFSGKRPFGNSGWKGDLEIALIQADHVEGALDEDGYIESVDSAMVDRLIALAIQELRTAWAD